MNSESLTYSDEATWSRRLWAAVADGILMVGVFLLFMFLGSSLGGMHGPSVFESLSTLILATGSWLLITVREVRKAASPGQSALELVVASRGGQPASKRALCIRWSVAHFATVLLMLFLIFSFYLLVGADWNHMGSVRARAGMLQRVGLCLIVVIATTSVTGWAITLCSGRAVYDWVADTKLFRARHQSSHRGFEPIVASPQPVAADAPTEESSMTVLARR